MKYRIKFFSDFASSKVLKKICEDINEVDTMDNYGVDKDIYITCDDDYTHVIIINFAMPELKPIDKKNVVGLAHEPTMFFTNMICYKYTPKFFFYLYDHVGKYYMGDTVYGQPFITEYSYMFYMKPIRHIPIKNKLISMIISEKNDQWFGYGYRHKIVQCILSMNLPIDIYGRGAKNYSQSEKDNVKGEFTEYEPYENYQFHICIENFITERYFSEKIINPLLANCVPIYLGCRNIKDYFGYDVIQLKGKLEYDMPLIIHILNYPNNYKKNINVEAIKNKMSLLRNLDTIFSV